MCGIAGFLHLDGKPASMTVIKGMTDAIRHRGPDGEGHHVDGALALGHRRLAILDLSPAGRQPMGLQEGRYTITYNGEVYNFKELRHQLGLLGHRFASDTDTEVVLHAYQEWGPGCVDRFNGMFAFALWDRVDRSLFLARDRYGVKPLYYVWAGDAFLFASESKAFNAFPGFRPTLDKRGLLEYMTFQNFFTDRTLTEGVRMFPAGHTAFLRHGCRELSWNQYWDFHFEEPTGKIMTEGEYAEELDHLIQQAVRRQLVSDVEIGSYLSGGMDSGSITALAARQLPYIKTFTVGFDLSSASGMELVYDERTKAEQMSYLFKTEHYEMVLKSGDMERCLPALAHHLEEPRVGQSYPNFYASKLASKFTKVVLSGCGGDEVFGGYPWRYYRSMGSKDFESYVDDYYQYWQRLIPNHVIQEVFAPIWGDVKDVWTHDIFRDVYKNHANRLERPEDYINHSLYFEAKTFLHGLLVVEDKLSMAHSLETRVPFLDNDLVDFGMKVPVGMKLNSLMGSERINENEYGKMRKFEMRTNDGKQILRKVMQSYIPPEVTGREKQGFSAPDASWFKGDSISYVRRKLLDGNALDHLFGPKIKDLVREHVEGKMNRRLLVWSLLNLAEIVENG